MLWSAIPITSKAKEFRVYKQRYIKNEAKRDEVFEYRRLGKTGASLVPDTGWDSTNATLKQPSLSDAPARPSPRLASVIWRGIHMSGATRSDS